MNAPQRQLDRQAFLANVRQSGLLSAEQLSEAERKVPAHVRGRAAARTLVEAGLLTRFQAERLLAGRTAGFLLGQYRILDQLGRGGMGRVFKAEHRAMGRLVALKVLAPGVVDNERAQELFLREVRAAARLVHPNIVTAYDANETGGRFYLVLEYVDGANLDQLVRNQGPLQVGLACDYVRQVAQGLQCAHALGMVHRDIKPANILVQRRGQSDNVPGLVKLSDFGLARLHTPNAPGGVSHHAGTILTRDNTVMGTPDFLSPEQARSLHKTDIRSDIYSLGCTFYYLLTGKVPFPGGTALEKLIRHTTETPEPLAKFRSDVPEGVTAVLSKMLAKHPSQRYQTPTELATALEPFAVSGAIPWAPPPSSAPYLDETETPANSAEDESDPKIPLESCDDLANLAAIAEGFKTSRRGLSSGVNRRPVIPAPTATPTPTPPTQPRRNWAPIVIWGLGLLGALVGGGVIAYMQLFPRP
jgi:serine/threonine-protein kinase